MKIMVLYYFYHHVAYKTYHNFQFQYISFNVNGKSKNMLGEGVGFVSRGNVSCRWCGRYPPLKQFKTFPRPIRSLTVKND